MILSVSKEFGSQIESIWQDDKFEEIEIKRRGFAVQDDIKQNALMFIGINPSYGGDPGCIFYNNSHGETHKYFKKFIDISINVEIDWTHLDLLFLRETSQNVVKALCKNTIGHSFIDEQLKISKKIIEGAKPKILVINNTYARDLLVSDSFSTNKFEFKFDSVLGTEKIIKNEVLDGTPTFFTSMLTGQRALDLGSYKRLIWHIEHVKKIIDK